MDDWRDQITEAVEAALADGATPGEIRVEVEGAIEMGGE